MSMYLVLEIKPRRESESECITCCRVEHVMSGYLIPTLSKKGGWTVPLATTC